MAVEARGFLVLVAKILVLEEGHYCHLRFVVSFVVRSSFARTPSLLHLWLLPLIFLGLTDQVPDSSSPFLELSKLLL